MQQKNSIYEFLHLEMHVSNKYDHTDLESVPPSVVPLLYQFTSALGLPSFCSNNHHVHLLPNSSPVNVKLYRYPHLKTNEMKIYYMKY